jgi:hypothetical protein
MATWILARNTPRWTSPCSQWEAEKQARILDWMRQGAGMDSFRRLLIWNYIHFRLPSHWWNRAPIQKTSGADGSRKVHQTPDHIVIGRSRFDSMREQEMRFGENKYLAAKPAPVGVCRGRKERKVFL